jgi:hypothetical protein
MKGARRAREAVDDDTFKDTPDDLAARFEAKLCLYDQYAEFVTALASLIETGRPEIQAAAQKADAAAVLLQTDDAPTKSLLEQVTTLQATQVDALRREQLRRVIEELDREVASAAPASLGVDPDLVGALQKDLAEGGEHLDKGALDQAEASVRSVLGRFARLRSRQLAASFDALPQGLSRGAWQRIAAELRPRAEGVEKEKDDLAAHRAYKQIRARLVSGMAAALVDAVDERAPEIEADDPASLASIEKIRELLRSVQTRPDAVDAERTYDTAVRQWMSLLRRPKLGEIRETARKSSS